MNGKDLQDPSANVDQLIDNLAKEGRPGAHDVLRLWLIDQFLQGKLPFSDACQRCGVDPQVFESWIQRRHVSQVSGTQASVDLTVIIPIFNEEENIEELHKRLTEALQPVCSFELLFVNDGSRDRSGELLASLRQNDKRVKILTFSRNFGHQGAITAGIDHCIGKATVIMDADLQDPPELLPSMIEKWREGFEVVYAVREKRKENVVKRFAYYSFYRILGWLATIDIPPDSGDFCLMGRPVVEALRNLPERNRFTRGLRVWVGYRHTALPYERAARHAGASKYSWSALMHLAIDGILAFSAFPLRLATYLGFTSLFLGIVYLAYALIARWTDGSVPRGWTSSTAIVLFMGGAQLLVLGVLGEYVARVFDESKRRPVYVVADFQN
jgi:polyisoprenyl-phosphate glycosyltransferase